MMTPPGYSVDEFRRMGQIIEQNIGRYWAAETGSEEHCKLDRSGSRRCGMIAEGQIRELQNPGLSGGWSSIARGASGLTPPPLIEDFFFVLWNGTCFMGRPAATRRVKPLERLLQTGRQRIPGVMAFFQQFQIFSFGSGNTVDIQVRGDDLANHPGGQRAADGVHAALLTAQPDPMNFDLGRPEVQIVPDRERAGELGLTAADIGFRIEACGDGAYVATTATGRRHDRHFPEGEGPGRAADGRHGAGAAVHAEPEHRTVDVGGPGQRHRCAAADQPH